MSDPQVMQALANLVPRGSRVLDLGCGNGAFLSLLQSQRGCTGYGVEIDDANVLACVQRGVSVIQLNLEQGLSMFEDQSFDVVLQIDTLQHAGDQTIALSVVRHAQHPGGNLQRFCFAGAKKQFAHHRLVWLAKWPRGSPLAQLACSHGGFYISVKP